MTTDETRPYLEHAPRCQRTRPPMLRASWGGAPEVWCPSCGRYAPAPDTRPTSTSTSTSTTERTTP